MEKVRDVDRVFSLVILMGVLHPRREHTLMGGVPASALGVSGRNAMSREDLGHWRRVLKPEFKRLYRNILEQKPTIRETSGACLHELEQRSGAVAQPG